MDNLNGGTPLCLTIDKYPMHRNNVLDNMEGLDLTSLYTTIGGVLGTPKNRR